MPRRPPVLVLLAAALSALAAEGPEAEPVSASEYAARWIEAVDFALPLADDAGDWFARLAACPPGPAEWPAARAALDFRAAALPAAERPPLLSGLRLALAAMDGDAAGVAAARADFAARGARADDTPDFLGGSTRDVCDAFLLELDERLARPPAPDAPPAGRTPAPTARDRVLADPLSATNALWFLAGVPAPPPGQLPNGDDFSLFALVCLASGDRARLADETARLLPDDRVLPGADAARAALALDAALLRSDLPAASRALVSLSAFAADPATRTVREANPSWFAPSALAARLAAWCDAVPPSGEGADAPALDAAFALLRSFGLGSGARLELGREALRPMANLLARLDREADAEALLRRAAGPDPAEWDEAADLVPLAAFLLGRGRPEAVLALCAESPAWSAGDLSHLAVYPQLGPLVARALAATGRTNDAERVARDLCLRFPAADRNGGLLALLAPDVRVAIRAAAALPPAPRGETWPAWARRRLAARALLPAAPRPPILPLPAAAARLAGRETPWWENHPPYGLPERLQVVLDRPPIPLFADPDAWPSALRDLVSFMP